MVAYLCPVGAKKNPDGSRLDPPSGCTSPWKELMPKCFALDPAKRPTFSSFGTGAGEDWYDVIYYINQIKYLKEVLKHLEIFTQSASHWCDIPGFSTRFIINIWHYTKHTKNIQLFLWSSINLESYMIQTIVSLEPLTSVVQSETINGPVSNQKCWRLWSNWNHELFLPTRVATTCNFSETFLNIAVAGLSVRDVRTAT